MSYVSGLRWPLLAAMFLQGCASLSGVGGSSEYSCKAEPGVRCQSVSGTYQNAIQNNLPSQRPAAPVASSRGESSGAAAGGGRIQPAAMMVSPSAGAPTAPGLMSLRAPARILRLWFKPWEDADHDLFDQGYIYVQVDGGRWMVDHAQRRIRDGYAPVRPPRTAQTPAAMPKAKTSPPLTSEPDASDAPESPREEALERLSSLKGMVRGEAASNTD